MGHDEKLDAIEAHVKALYFEPELVIDDELMVMPTTVDVMERTSALLPELDEEE